MSFDSLMLSALHSCGPDACANCFAEVNFKCWSSNPDVAKYLDSKNKTTTDLLNQFFVRERKLLPASKAAIYWDEIVSTDLHSSLNPNDVVQFWHDSSSGLLQQYLAETPATNTAIVSAYNAYYLDCGTGNEFGEQSWCDPYKTWRSIYYNDPISGIVSTPMDRP